MYMFAISVLDTLLKTTENIANNMNCHYRPYCEKTDYHTFSVHSKHPIFGPFSPYIFLTKIQRKAH